MSSLGLIYLLRAKNGYEPVRAFAEAYGQHPAGCKHDLVVLYKGFVSVRETEKYHSCWNGISHRKLLVRDRGYDLEAYFMAVAQLPHVRFCFLNSYSRPLDAGWLQKLQAAIEMPSVGLVGATGSWESLYTNAEQEEVLGIRRTLWRHWLRPLRLRVLRRRFPCFPNPHLRTTAFMADRAILERLSVPRMRWKMEALGFETGHNSVTRQVAALSLAVRIVGRDCHPYAPNEWARSGTFRQNRQENLLVSDNRTRQYEEATAGERQLLSYLSWGDAARTR